MLGTFSDVFIFGENGEEKNLFHLFEKRIFIIVLYSVAHFLLPQNGFFRS